MNKEICNLVVLHKAQFVPHLFTVKQVNLMEKYLNDAQLTRTEQVYLYSTIRKKTDALQILKERIYIYGSDMIPERIKTAKQILSEINKEMAFISGSFLFSKEYRDIDIYIISKKRKQYHEGKKHFICITEEDMKKPIFISAFKYSVSNFSMGLNPTFRRPFFDDLMFAYQEAIIEILNEDDQKEVRSIVFEYYKHVKGRILDSYSLHKLWKELTFMKKEEKIKTLNRMIKELIFRLYKRSYVYEGVRQLGSRIRATIPKYPKADEGLIICNDFLVGIQDECRRNKAKV